MPGRGILAEVDSEDIILGNIQMLQEHQVKLPDEIQNKVESEEYRLLSIVFVAINNQMGPYREGLLNLGYSIEEVSAGVANYMGIIAA